VAKSTEARKREVSLGGNSAMVIRANRADIISVAQGMLH
jgi:hypothetical protein